MRGVRLPGLRRHRVARCASGHVSARRPAEGEHPDLHPPRRRRPASPAQRRELRALRAYASTVYSCGTVLLDAGLASAEVASLPLSAIDAGGNIAGTSLAPHARELLAIHRHLRDLEGADERSPFIGRDHNRIVADRRLVATELGLPGSQSNADSRSGTGAKWKTGLGLAMQPLEGQHLREVVPTKATKQAAAKELS